MRHNRSARCPYCGCTRKNIDALRTHLVKSPVCMLLRSLCWQWGVDPFSGQKQRPIPMAEKEGAR